MVSVNRKNPEWTCNWHSKHIIYDISGSVWLIPWSTLKNVHRWIIIMLSSKCILLLACIYCIQVLISWMNCCVVLLWSCLCFFFFFRAAIRVTELSDWKKKWNWKIFHVNIIENLLNSCRDVLRWEEETYKPNFLLLLMIFSCYDYVCFVAFEFSSLFSFYVSIRSQKYILQFFSWFLNCILCRDGKHWI